MEMPGYRPVQHVMNANGFTADAMLSTPNNVSPSVSFFDLLPATRWWPRGWSVQSAEVRSAMWLGLKRVP